MDAARMIPGTDRYSVTADGRVFSHVRRRPIGAGRNGLAGSETEATLLPQWALMQHLNPVTGYIYVNLTLNKKHAARTVHRLVLLAWKGEPSSPDLVARHLDGNKFNNHVDNLEWGTQAENIADIERHGRRRKGEKSYQALLTAEKVLAARADRAGGMTWKALGVKYGVSSGTIEDAVKGRTWKHVQAGKAA